MRAAAAGAEPVGPEPDRRTAQRFRQLLLDLGPTFIKLGQLLSSRPDILPSHWVEELSELQDAVPPFPLSEVRAEIERGLGRPVEVCFAELDEAPLASASIAQVHRARTHAGEPVVVKVQRPRIRQRIESDLSLLYQLARLVEAVVEETGRLHAHRHRGGVRPRHPRGARLPRRGQERPRDVRGGQGPRVHGHPARAG